MQEMMSKYCKATTLNHSVAQSQGNKECINLINCIVKKESFHQKEERCKDYKNICFGDAEAINLDCVTGRTSKSMDIAVGLNTGKFLLIDFKFNADTVPKNIECKDIKEKIEDSKRHIQNIEKSILVYCNRTRQRRYLEGSHSKHKRKKLEGIGVKLIHLEKLKKRIFLKLCTLETNNIQTTTSITPLYIQKDKIKRSKKFKEIKLFYIFFKRFMFSLEVFFFWQIFKPLIGFL